MGRLRRAGACGTGLVAAALTLPVTVPLDRGTVDSQQQPPAKATRHRTHHSPRRPHAVLVRLSDDEKRVIAAAAQAAQLTPTGYTAKAAVEAATAGQAPTGAPGDLRELQHELFAARRALNMLGSNVNQAAAAVNSGAGLPDWAADAVRLAAAAVQRVDEITARINRRLR